jgi:hypothetical protein
MPGAKLAESIKMAEKCLNLGRILWFLPVAGRVFRRFEKDRSSKA